MLDGLMDGIIFWRLVRVTWRIGLLKCADDMVVVFLGVIHMLVVLLNTCELP